MSGRAHDGTVFQPLGEEDPQHVAGYRLAARLGAGGMGKVYLSYTPGGRPIAIKVIRPDFAQDAEFRRRFAQEVQAAQRVQGLYTAPVIDADPEAKQPWLATAYVPGPSLADAVIQHGKLPVDTVLLLVAGIAEALHVIHGAGIVHRDLKPANVLLASDGPRVIDFGIARAADATSLTSSGVTIGTPSFMAPEQAAGSTVTAATDIFALGQIAAYASTGKAAFGEGTSHGVLYRIVHEEPDLTGLPDQLRELVTRCLTKDPEARPSVADLLAICQSANGETVLRRPEEWLPGAVAAEITTRKAAPAPPVTPPAGQAPAPVQPPAHPPTQAATQAPVQPPGQQPPHYAPTQTAGQAQLQSPAPVTPPTAASAPATPPPGFGPPPQNPTYGYPQAHATPYGQTAPQHVRPPQPYPPQPYQMVSGPRPPGAPKKNSRSAAIGVVIAVVALGGLVGGGIYLSGKDKDKGNQSQGQDNPGSTPDASGGGATDSPGGDKSSKPGEPVKDPTPKTYNGLNVTDDYGINLGDEPVKPISAESSDAVDFEHEYYIGNIAAKNSKIVLLRTDQQADLATCKSETRFAPLLTIKNLSKGAKFCVLSETGNVGLVTYQGRAPESDPSHYITVDVTVWRGAIDSVQPSY
ncbi:serine/threonine protein kinase [Streptomyces lunaelactis]|uniref:serine/threonine-protein kinase n=7 Tax=Streptomyces lunaelactis TaxID=1535768 RepID=UPI0015852D5C|nr:serine/threonine-protein kinase [Streptomyces lunaelactis]NUL30444.1 serine/threonine protein kinase [Streptomyces lunaelactis]